MKTETGPDYKYMNRLENISFNPIFILGLHRSGTSILYKMLGETGHFNTVTAYHILKYNELLHNHINKLENKVLEDLTNLFKSKGISDRRIDHLPITPDFAQEYVYIFEKYKSTLSKENLWLFENLCKKIQFISENNKPILLKNPYDFPNFLFIKKTFPNAKLIFIHRNPLMVISSNMRAWQTLYESKNPYTALFSHQYDQVFDNPILLFIQRMYYSSSFPLGVFSVINYSLRGTNYFLQNIDSLSKVDNISIKYEDLCEKPNLVMKNIMDFLHLKTDLDFSDFIKPRKLKVMPNVLRMENYIKKKMKEYNKKFKY